MPRKKIIEQQDTGYSFYKRYLEKGMELLDTMSRKHRKVMQTRMDFRYPQEILTESASVTSPEREVSSAGTGRGRAAAGIC